MFRVAFMASFKNNQNNVWGKKAEELLGGEVEGVGEAWKPLQKAAIHQEYRKVLFLQAHGSLVHATRNKEKPETWVLTQQTHCPVSFLQFCLWEERETGMNSA